MSRDGKQISFQWFSREVARADDLCNLVPLARNNWLDLNCKVCGAEVYQQRLREKISPERDLLHNNLFIMLHKACRKRKDVYAISTSGDFHRITQNPVIFRPK